MTEINKIYLITPFSNLDYPFSWKVYYCTELFSALTKRGYVITWLQPGKNCFNLHLYPSISRWREFVTVNIGSYLTYRWYIPFFLSRLKKVNRVGSPLLFFEVVDGNPLPVNIESYFMLVPIIFSLNPKWYATEHLPSPVIAPNEGIVRELLARGVPETFIKHIPCSTYRYKKESDNLTKDREYVIMVIDKNRKMEEIFNVLKAQFRGCEIIYYNHNKREVSNVSNFSEILKSLKGRYRKIIAVLGKGLFHLGLEIVASGGVVVGPWAETDEYRGIEGSAIYYHNVSEVTELITHLIEEPENICNYIEKLDTWEQSAEKLEVLINELIGSRKSFTEK